MFVMIRQYSGCPDAREVNRRVQVAAVMNVITSMPGIQSYSVVDHGDGVVATVGVFETREQAENSAAIARPIVAEHFADLLPNAPEIIVAEVLSTYRKS